MFEHEPKEEILYIIRAIETDPASTQRTLSGKLGISLGKTNYLLRELVKKGIIKVKCLSENPDKFKRIGYCLTSKGAQEKVRLTQLFLKKKEAEYLMVKRDWEASGVDRIKKLAI